MIKFQDILLASTAAIFDFTSVPQTALHLMIRVIARGDTSALTVDVNIRFNNDTTNSYYDIGVTNNGTAVTGIEHGTPIASGNIGLATAATGVAGYMGDITVNIGDYTVAKQHNWTGLSHTLWNSGANNHNVRVAGGVYSGVAAITRVTIVPVGGNFVAGSRATLYGLN